MLPRLVALTLDAKQAHWNVTGPGFVQLHALTDELAADVRAWTDRLAERAVAVGAPVDARPATVAAAAGPSFPKGWLTDREAAVELVERIGSVAELIHASLAELELSDAVAHDAAVETLEGLEKYRWMLVAHTRRARVCWRRRTPRHSEEERRMKADQLDRRIKEIELELLRADPALGRQFAKLARVNRRHETTVFALLVSSAVFLTIGLATISVVAWLVGVVSLIASFSVDTRYEHQLRAIRRPSEFGHRPRNRHLRCSEQR